MGVTDRKEREKEEMRIKILDASRHLFLTQGFEKTSIRNIAEVIEYSPSTIYLYFKDKNELLFALHTQAFEGMMKEFMSLIDIKDPFERLIQLGYKYIHFGVANPELYELMFLLDAPIETLYCNKEIWQDGLTLFSVLMAVIEECKKSGRFKNLSTDELAMMMWSQVHGLATIHIKRRTMMFEENDRLPRLIKGYELFIKTIENL